MSPPPLPSPAPDRRGFLLPALFDADSHLYGRWDYLTVAWTTGKLPEAPIPRIRFLGAPDKATWNMITGCLDAIPNHGRGGWQGWAGSENFRYFLEWLLYGFHHHGQPEPPREPMGCEGASQRLAKVLDLALWLENPYDYLGDILADNAYGKRQGFFPTPAVVAELMTRMTIGAEAEQQSSNADATAGGAGRDTRILTVCDPCTGTGRLLLHASNYSLRLYGQDVDAIMCLSTLVNGYLFAPWLVRPLPFLDQEQYNGARSAAVSDAITGQAPPHIAAVLADTEHDAGEQWKFEPVKKRKPRAAPPAPEVRQGILFEP